MNNGSMNMVVAAKRVSFILPLEDIQGGVETMKLYRKVVAFGEMYQAAFAMLMDAVKSGDAEGIKIYFDAVVYFEHMQRVAAIETRSHLLEKVRA